MPNEDIGETCADPAELAVQRFVGHLDQLDDYVLSGWIYTREEDFFANLELDAYFNGRRVLTVKPSAKRDDLRPFFGPANVGFHASVASVKSDILAACSGAANAGETAEIIRGLFDVRIAGADISLSKRLFRLGKPFSAGFSSGAVLPSLPVIGKRSQSLDGSAPEATMLSDVGELAWQFDPTFYLDAEPDVRRAGVDPLWHYEQFGEREGRKPNPFFDPGFYRRVYADVREAGINALSHYRDSGRFEGRQPASPLQELAKSARSILFVGHDAYAAGAQKVLLETVRWFARHTTLNVRVLLLGFGHLTTDFAGAAKCYTSVNLDKDHQDLVECLFGGRPPDIVYCNTVVSGRLFLSSLATFFRTSKVIAHCHEMSNVLREFPDQLAALVARADQWICASAAIPPYLQAECNVPAGKISVVLPFIEPSTISAPAVPAYRAAMRAEFGIGAADLVVIGCGTVNHRKGPDIFVEVAKQLRSQRPWRPLHFIWVGDGEERAALEQEIKESGLESLVRFTGYRKDSADLMAMADLLFLPSREDPFPLVVLEAGQFAVPTVCFSEGVGIAAFVAARRGLVCKERSNELAASAVDRLLISHELRKGFGVNAQQSVAADHFTTSAMRKIMVEVYALGLAPAVSIIVPNYNHENFIDQRLRSILDQTIEDYEIIVLDDFSQDNSILRIKAYLQDLRVSLFVNDANSGSVFAQWRKGIDLARAEVIWIAESDDFCDSDFLERLLPFMSDPDVNISFARTRMVNEAGELQVGALRPYMDRFRIGFGLEDFKLSGAQFVNDGFGALCTIVNASGALLRKSVTRQALASTKQYRMCGDWRVYLECCLTGSVCFSARTTSYFRRHEASTVHRLEGTDQYFSERLAIAEYVVSQFWTTPLLHRKMQAEVLNEVERFKGRFDPAFCGLGTEMLARARARQNVSGRIHVCFYVHGLLFSKGGIERLFALVASALVDRGYRVSVACRIGLGKQPVYTLRHGIKIIPVDVWSEQGLRQLRSHLMLDMVDVLVPMLSEDLFERVIDTARGLAIPVIASEHNDPWVIERDWWNSEGRRDTFARCRVIHLLSEQFRNSLPNFLRSRIRVIPNPVTPGFFGCTRRRTTRKRIIAVGRLAPQKSFDILLQAFALVKATFDQWDLVIFGEGELRPELEALVSDLDLSGRASLPGESDRLPDEMEISDICVMPSRFEGFGMALVEGMAAGLPGLAFADCNGPNEIIEHGENGLLVSARTSEALAASLELLLRDDELRHRLGARARGVALKFSLKAVVDQWEDMITVDCGLV